MCCRTEEEQKKEQEEQKEKHGGGSWGVEGGVGGARVSGQGVFVWEDLGGRETETNRDRDRRKENNSANWRINILSFCF